MKILTAVYGPDMKCFLMLFESKMAEITEIRKITTVTWNWTQSCPKEQKYYKHIC